MEAKKVELSADEAIDIAFDLFERYVSRGKTLNNTLLEGLEPDSGGWVVSIGFTGERYKESSSPFGLADRSKEPLREIRHFHISQEGDFLRMT